MADELVVREGDEDVQYVLLDLPDAPEDPSQPDPFAPGARLAVRIDPSTGEVRVSSAASAVAEGADNAPAALLEGRFEETVGSVLVVRPPPPPASGGPAGPAGGDEERRTRARREEDGNNEAAPPPNATTTAATVVATVETRIVRKT